MELAAGNKREPIGALLDWQSPALEPPAPLPPPKCPGCGQVMFLLGRCRERRRET